MKVGIVTHYYKSENYGGNLQAYALCKVIEGLGHEVEQISLNRVKDKGIAFFLKRVIKKVLKFDIRNVSNFRKRKKAFLKFNLKKIPHSKEYSERTINQSADCYDAFITGSDQVWHPYAVCEAYLLTFVPKSKIKLSYAASVAHDNLNVAQKNRYKKALSDFDAVSVRESESKTLISPLAPCAVETTLDPTLLLSKEEWIEMVEPIGINEDYLFCYFLGDDKNQRELAVEYAKKYNLKIVTLPNLLGKTRKCDNKFGDYKLYDVTPQNFLYLINNAKCVFTDSFHACVFSLIFEKEYFAFERSGAKSMSSRIRTLSSIFETETHFCDCEEKISFSYINKIDKIDYSKEQTHLLNLKEKSIQFLANNLNIAKPKKNRAINIVNKTECTGCYSCSSVCPNKCISMASDEEGFKYPLVDYNKCIECGLCIKSCPIATPKKTNKSLEDVHAIGAYNKNEDIRRKSSSGGIFTVIANFVIDNDGIVFGAAFNEDFSVSHKEALTKEELSQFRGSKYVQSEIGDSYKKAKEYLEKGKMVLFSGTPCQIGGLYSYLNKEYDNLITQDIICHGVPSPMVWKKYIEKRENENEAKTQSVFFKDKRTGWKTYSITMNFENGKEYTKKAGMDLMMRSFIGNLCLRPSCHSCSFKSLTRQSDVTLADFWGANKIAPNMDDDKGLSLVIINSEKGKKLLQFVENEIVKFNTNLEEAVLYNSSMVRSAIAPSKRTSFMTRIVNEDFDKVAKDHLKIPFKRKIKRLIKRILGIR